MTAPLSLSALERAHLSDRVARLRIAAEEDRKRAVRESWGGRRHSEGRPARVSEAPPSAIPAPTEPTRRRRYKPKGAVDAAARKAFVAWCERQLADPPKPPTIVEQPEEWWEAAAELLRGCADEFEASTALAVARADCADGFDLLDHVRRVAAVTRRARC